MVASVLGHCSGSVHMTVNGTPGFTLGPDQGLRSMNACVSPLGSGIGSLHDQPQHRANQAFQRHTECVTALVAPGFSIPALALTVGWRTVDVVIRL